MSDSESASSSPICDYDDDDEDYEHDDDDDDDDDEDFNPKRRKGGRRGRGSGRGSEARQTRVAGADEVAEPRPRVTIKEKAFWTPSLSTSSTYSRRSQIATSTARLLHPRAHISAARFAAESVRWT